MAGLKVLSAPQGVPNSISVVNQPANLPAGPLKVTNKPANQPAKLPVVSKPANVPAKVSVQPLPQQPKIQVPPRPPQLDKIAADIGVARGRGADDTTILNAMLQKNPALAPAVQIAIKERGATPADVLNAIVQKHQPQAQEATEEPGFLGMSRDNYLDPNVVFGIGKGIGQSFARLGNLIAKPLDAAYEKVTGQKPAIPASLTEEQLTPKSRAEKVGKFAGDTTQFVLGANATKPLVSSISATTAKTALPQASKTLINTFGRSVVSGGEAYGLSKLQGANEEDATTNALIAGALPWAGAAFNAVKPALREGGKAIQYKIIKPTKTDLSNGFKIDNVFKYQLDGDLTQMAEKTQSAITERATKLKGMLKPGSAQVDLNKVYYDTVESLGGKTVENAGSNLALKAQLERFAKEMDELSPNGIIDIADAQKIKRAFGAKGAWQYGVPAEDSNAIETIYTKAYNLLKTEIEKAASSAGSTGVKQINRELSELIPVEQALIRRLPVAARQNVFSLTDLVSLIGQTKTGVPLFILNRLSKSGKVGSKLYRAGSEATSRSGVGTTVFGPTSGDIQKATPLEPSIGLSTRNVSRVKPANPKYRGKGKVTPTKMIRVNRYDNPYPKIIKPQR
jgi:hypothetical protein